MIGALGQTTAYAHDKQSNLTTVTDPHSDATNYNYDALNRLSHGIDPNGGITSYAYDANDHLTAVLDPRATRGMGSTINCSLQVPTPASPTVHMTPPAMWSRPPTRAG